MKTKEPIKADKKKRPKIKLTPLTAFLGLILLLAGIFILFLLLAFMAVISPVLGFCFIVWQIAGVIKSRNENKLNYLGKLKTNRDYLQFQYKKHKINETA